MKKKIVIFSSHPSNGGSELLWQHLVEYIKIYRKDIELLICVNKTFKNKLNNLISSNIEIIYWDFMFSPNNKIFSRLIYYTIRKAKHLFCYVKIKKFNPSIILINEGNALEFIYYLPFLSKLILQNYKYYPLAHMTNKFQVRSNNKDLFINYYKNAEQSLFVSAKTANEVSEALAYTIQNVKIVRNTVSFKNLTIIPYPQTNSLNFAIVASVDKRKNQEVLLNILSKPKWNNRKWKLNIYGDGYLKEYLINLCEKLNLCNKVFFNGYTSDIREVWKENHLNILPSYNESAPISIVEAMICGRPTVATNVGGVSEWIDKNTGFLASTPSFEDIDKALETAWQNKNKWGKIGENAHKKAMEMIGEPEKDLLKILIESKQKS